MTYVAVDTIVKSVLLRRGYPMHFYLQFLKYATDCVRELGYSTFKTIQTEIILIDEFGQVALPENYEKWVRVGRVNGQHVRPLVQSTGFLRTLAKDTGGNNVPYGPPANSYTGGWGWLNNWVLNTNDYGEATGGYFGMGMGYETDMFEEIPERNVIQVSQEIAGQYAVLDYTPNVAHPTNLSRIPQMAQSTIEQYVIWQMKEHGRHYPKGEAKDEERMYYGELRHLRARLNPMSPDDWLRAFRREFRATPKS